MQLPKERRSSGYLGCKIIIQKKRGAHTERRDRDRRGGSQRGGAAWSLGEVTGASRRAWICGGGRSCRHPEGRLQRTRPRTDAPPSLIQNPFAPLASRAIIPTPNGLLALLGNLAQGNRNVRLVPGWCRWRYRNVCRYVP